MAKKELVYGVDYVSGKYVATIYPDEESVPKRARLVYESELMDYLESVTKKG